MRWIAIVFSAGCWTGSAPAPAPVANTSSAAPVLELPPRDDSKERARELYEAGEKHYNAGDFTAAAEDFEEAYRVAPNYVLLYNIGQAYRQAGDRTRAIDSYQRYLDEGGAQIRQPIRDMVTDQIQKLSGAP